MAEVDWAEWAIEAADGFRETKWQNIGVALRQLAHELIDTRARLTTAEQERSQTLEILGRFEDEENDEATPPLAELARRCFEWGDRAWYQAGKEMEAREAAEARVEALSAALAGYVGVYHRSCHIGAHHEWDLRVTDAVRDRARAALACPPQQPPDEIDPRDYARSGPARL